MLLNPFSFRPHSKYIIYTSSSKRTFISLFLNKRRTPTSLYLFIQKDFSFEIMLKILHFSPNLLFHNSIERDTQLGQLRFQRGKLRSLLRKEKNPNISGSQWRLESFTLNFKSIRNINKFSLEVQNRNRPVNQTFKLALLLGRSSLDLLKFSSLSMDEGDFLSIYWVK